MTTRDTGNPELLRADIDAGRTGDKGAASDPAAAPLGTDSEAGGTPPSAAEVEQARKAEARPVSGKGVNKQSPQPTPHGNIGFATDPGTLSGKLFLAVLVLAVLAFSGWILIGNLRA